MNEWESVINSDLFERAGFILVFTHCDILAEEVRKMPIRRRYLARRDANDLPSFFAGKFLSVPRKFSHQLIRVVITGLTEDSAEIEILFDQALSQAAEHNTYMQRHGKPKGPLHGLPISMKDTFRLPGVDRTFGIAALAGRPSSSASTIIDILFCAGAIPFCKTNCSMALIGPDYNNNIFGRTLNPYNKKLCTGGSTGGEAVLVSMKGSPLGVGADLEAPLPPLQHVLDETAACLKKAGHTVISLPQLPHADEMITEVLNPLSNNDNLKNWLPAIEATREPLTPWIQAHGKIKPDLRLEELRRLHQRRERLMSEMNNILWRMSEDDEIDAVICPVAPHPTPPLDTWVTKGYTSLWSGMGLPSGVIPVRLFEEGDATVESDVEKYGDSCDPSQLVEIWRAEIREKYIGTPLCIQVVGPRLQERRLLQAMSVVEAELRSRIHL
ncbi:MAG: hypothetical protein Q9162_000595 [Coniocarpon cinnabarinum]